MKFYRKGLALALKSAILAATAMFFFACSPEEKDEVSNVADPKNSEFVTVLFWNHLADHGAPDAPAPMRVERNRAMILPVAGTRGPAAPGANATDAQISTHENFGWRFLGWFNQAGVRIGGAGDTIVAAQADTLISRWQPISEARRATVTFNANVPEGTQIGGRVPAPLTVISRAGDPAVPAAQAIHASVFAVNSGARFNRTAGRHSITAWSKTPTIAANAVRGTDFWNIRDTIPVTGNMTLYAIWDAWGNNIQISWHVGGPIVGGVNQLRSPIAITGNAFTANIDEAYILVRYPYLEAGHWAGVNVETERSGRHAAGSIELWPNLDLRSRDITHPVVGAFAVNLRAENFQHLGTIDRNTNAIVAAAIIQRGTLPDASGNLVAITDAQRDSLQRIADTRLEGGEHGAPWMRVFWPGAYVHRNGVELANTNNDIIPGQTMQQTADNWWSRVVTNMSQNGTLNGDAPAITRLRTAGHDGLGAGYFLSGTFNTGTENEISFEVLGRWTNAQGRYANSQQHARPALSQYFVAEGQILNFRRRAHVHRWLNEVLAFYRIHYDFEELAQRSLALGLTDVEGRIVFGRELVIAHPAIMDGDEVVRPAIPAYVPTRGTLPAGRTLWDEINGSILMNAANWDFTATTINNQ